MSENWANEIGESVYGSVAEMVGALECDYDKLAELANAEEDLDEIEKEELAELRAQAGECANQDEARERIMEDALSVEVRSGWTILGGTMVAEEFMILLCTGGPAARIRGELDEHGQPCRAWFEVQDWGTPWAQYFQADQTILLTYASCFYFGEG